MSMIVTGKKRLTDCQRVRGNKICVCPLLTVQRGSLFWLDTVSINTLIRCMTNELCKKEKLPYPLIWQHEEATKERKDS